MTILFLIAVAACWVLGIADGDCTAALMFSMFGVLAAVDEMKKRRARAKRRARVARGTVKQISGRTSRQTEAKAPTKYVS